MKSSSSTPRRGFTLLETVIAIGVLAVLLTGFMVVFAPAAEGIRKSINVQQADRLAAALEQELTVNRGNDNSPGFEKAFNWIKESNNSSDALIVYQYRAAIGGNPRQDGTPAPEPSLNGKRPGEDFVVVTMVRSLGDATSKANLEQDLPAIEGGLYLVKCTQIGFENSQMVLGSPGKIVDPKIVGQQMTERPDMEIANYPEAVIAFAADFHMLPAKTYSYLTGSAFEKKFTSVKNPVFSRNLAVRR